jgi:hypothetical protein
MSSVIIAPPLTGNVLGSTSEAFVRPNGVTQQLPAGSAKADRASVHGPKSIGHASAVSLVRLRTAGLLVGVFCPGNSLPDLPRPNHFILRRSQFGERKWPAAVQLLGADTHLRPKTEFASVGETRGCIPINRR